MEGRIGSMRKNATRGEVVTYKGIRFRRYPDAKDSSSRNYFTPGIQDRLNGVKRLHQEIWEDHHGPIPQGYHVHHKDGNPLNNDIENLECQPYVEHLGNHLRENPREVSEAARAAAAEWHRSEEGRAWHSELGKLAWENCGYVQKVCEHCGIEYEEPTTGAHSRFCSNACKSAWRRAKGIDDETRICAFCNQEFIVNKYSKKRFCSRSCAASDYWAGKKAGL
jgi:hypothetical protein